MNRVAEYSARYAAMIMPSTCAFFDILYRIPKIANSANASYSCVGCSGLFNGTPTSSFATGSVNVTAHGRSHSTPQQQPAMKQPMRPMPWPNAIDGAKTSAVFQPGSFDFRMYH